MLPEALSNELCSLKPQVDRLTKCVEFLLADDGRVLEAKFYSAVIRSKRRFNYKEAFQVLQRAAKDPLERMLHDANAIAQKIRRARFKAGSLALDFPETKIYVDAKGAVDRIEKVENDISHQLIEEFMLLANEAVAGKLMSSGRQAVYRIHEPPEPKRLEEYREELLINRIPCGNLMNRHEVQKVLAHLDRLPIGQALKIGFLKSLMRARYSTEPVGHYGLNKKKYTHFTSPIRRYADLLVHRALFQTELRPAAGQLQEIAEHISETERNSDDAERDSRDVKLFAHLRGQLESGEPETYNALVIDLRNFGFFVDVTDLGMSGLVHLSSMSDDFYVLDPARGQLVGRRTRRVIRMGDKVQVRVAKVDTYKRQVDFELAVTKGPRQRLEERDGVRRPAAARPRPAHPAPAHRARTAGGVQIQAGRRRR
jgi:ribonuclease R